MLLALGVGSATAAAGGLSSAAARRGADDDGNGSGTDDGGGDGGGSNQCPPCIDAYSGYLVPAQERDRRPQPENVDPVETVELRVEDADVVFPEEGEGETGGSTETATPGATPMGTETPAQETPTGTPTGGGGDGSGFPDFFFDPVGVAIAPGDTVEFLVVHDLHTVTAYHPRFFGQQRRVPEGTPGFTSPPVVAGDYWYYTFEEAGVYDLQCLPHEGLGMVMRVVVPEDDDDVPEAPPEPGAGEAGPSPVARTVLNAPELEPENVVDQGTVAWDDLTGVATEPPTF